MGYERKDAFHARAKREGLRLARGVQAGGDPARARGCCAPATASPTSAAGRAAGSRWRRARSGRRAAWWASTSPRSTPADPNENAIAFVGDLADACGFAADSRALGGPADVVLSDAAPKLTGIRVADRAREEALLEAIEARIPELLRPGGSALAKLLDCPEADQFRVRIKKRFAEGRVLKPEATRKGSTEKYLLLRGFRP